MSELYIGLMSGTSLDGIDAALVDFSDENIRLVDFHYTPYTDELRQRVHAISQPNHPILLKDYGYLDSELGQWFAQAAIAVLEKSGISHHRIKAIGSHGQTVYHEPNPHNGFSLQIGDPNRIAQLTGITTVADFRRRDIAAHGQGAPLVPAFHDAIFANSQCPKAIVNIGGIANITILNEKPILGFDTGPGNTLLDLWHQHHRQLPYDVDGSWAASGKAHPSLLKTFLDDDYFSRPPPKSTGKEYFSPAWLDRKLERFGDINAEDIQATLCELTAHSIVDAINLYAQSCQKILVCGGGVHNPVLMTLLQHHLSMPVVSTSALGVDPDGVEAIAFAWLARQTLNDLPGNVCSVTGAETPVILGGIYTGKPPISSGK